MDIRKALRAVVLGAVVSSSVLLAACGGGGGGSSSSFSASSSGSAVLGVVSGATVTAVELDANGNAVGEVGSAVTAADGTYALTIGAAYTGGPVLLTLSGAGATMTCDVVGGCGAVAWGDPVALDASFEMNAILPPVTSGATVSAQITPFTHMAAARALAHGGALTADVIRNANSEVSQILGVDVMSTVPADLTDLQGDESYQTEIYAAFVSAITDWMFSSGGGLDAGIDALAAMFEDGEFTTADGDLAAMQEMVSNVQTDGVAMFGGVPPVELAAWTAYLDTQMAGDSYNPEPGESATTPALVQAKALVGETRTWITSLRDLDTPAEAFRADIETAAQVFDANSTALLEVAGASISAAYLDLRTRAKAGTLVLDTNYSVDVPDGAGGVWGQVLYKVTDDGGNATLTVSVADIEGVIVNLSVATTLPVSDLGEETFSATIAAAIVNGSVEKGVASVEFSDVAASITLADAMVVNLDTGNSDHEQRVDEILLDGDITVNVSGAQFLGQVHMLTVASNLSLTVVETSLKELTVSGTFTSDTTGSFTATASLDVTNAADVDTWALLAGEGVLYPRALESGDVLHAESVFTDFQAGEWIFYDSWYGGTCHEKLDGTYDCRAGDILGAAAYMEGLMNASYPAAIYDQGYYDYDGINSLFEPRIVVTSLENADYFAEGTLSLTLDLALTGYPDTTATMTVNRTGLEAGTATVILSHGGQSVTFVGTLPETGLGNATLTVSYPDGAQLVVTGTEGDVSGEVTVDGEVVAQVTSDEDLVFVYYVDGTFETLQ